MFVVPLGVEGWVRILLLFSTQFLIRFEHVISRRFLSWDVPWALCARTDAQRKWKKEREQVKHGAMSREEMSIGLLNGSSAGVAFGAPASEGSQFRVGMAPQDVLTKITNRKRRHDARASDPTGTRDRGRGSGGKQSANHKVYSVARDVESIFQEYMATMRRQQHKQTGSDAAFPPVNLMEVATLLQRFLLEREGQGTGRGDGRDDRASEDDPIDDDPAPLWEQSLRCLLSVWLCALGDGMDGEMPHLTSADGDIEVLTPVGTGNLSESPFFGFLVDQVLIRLRSIMAEASAHDDKERETMLLQRECLLLVLQTIVAASEIEDGSGWQSTFEDFKVETNNLDEITTRQLEILHDAIQPLLTRHNTERPVAPPPQDDAKNQFDDVIGALFTAVGETETSLFSSAMEQSLSQSFEQQFGLSILHDIDKDDVEKETPRAPNKPSVSLGDLPPPIFPLVGSHVGIDAATATQLNDAAMRSLNSGMIWLGPQYPSLRLTLMRPDDEAAGQQTPGDTARETPTDERSSATVASDRAVADAEIIDILTNRAFVIPLTPVDERKVIDALSGIDMADNASDGQLAGTVGTKSNKKKKSKSKQKQQSNGPVRNSGRTAWEKRALNLVQSSSLNPQTMARLVDNNPSVAIECLLLLLTAPESSVSANVKNSYLTGLSGMDMTIHSMEVVNRLASHNVRGERISGKAGGGRASNGVRSNGSASKRGDDDDEEEPLLHPEYIHLYISTCITTCEGMSYDRHLQNKSVRLLCVFLQSLIRNGIVRVAVSSFFKPFPP